MDCKEARQFINLYIDSELDAKTDLEISKHLAVCKECNKRFAQEQKMEEGFVSVFSEVEDPVKERREIDRIWTKTIAKITRQEMPGLRIRYLVPALSGIIAIIFFVIYSFPDEIDLVTAAGKCHMEYIENKIAPTFETQIPEEAADYFSGKFDFAITLPSEKKNNNASRLIGARVCHLNEVSVAYAMYIYSSLSLSLFFIDEKDLNKFPVAKKILSDHECIEKTDIHGNNFVAMRTDSSIVCAVSALDLRSLRDIVKDCEPK